MEFLSDDNNEEEKKEVHIFKLNKAINSSNARRAPKIKRSRTNMKLGISNELNINEKSM